jgi:hypothetical protein
MKQSIKNLKKVLRNYIFLNEELRANLKDFYDEIKEQELIIKKQVEKIIELENDSHNRTNI